MAQLRRACNNAWQIPAIFLASNLVELLTVQLKNLQGIELFLRGVCAAGFGTSKTSHLDKSSQLSTHVASEDR